MTLHCVKTGIDLNSSVDKIRLVTTEEEHFLLINLDDYFEGFRDNIKALYPEDAGSLAYTEINDTSLFNLTYSIVDQSEFEIANIRYNNNTQKTLIQLNQTLYLYVDCEDMIYLLVTDEAVMVHKSFEHEIQGKITKVKYLPDYFKDGEGYGSYGTAVVQYLINGCEELIKFCDVHPDSPPNCNQPVNYPLGHILDYFMYSTGNETKKDYFIIGSYSIQSHYSLIRFFEDVSCPDCRPDFRYIGEISASTLDSPKFCLDSLTMFSHFLIFTNHTSLFVLDMEDYIDSPQWFTPKQVREVSIDDLLRQYSGNMYKEAINITDIHIEETCLEHLTMYIFTQKYGILMLEINKISFYSERWHKDHIRVLDGSQLDNPTSVSDSYKYKLGSGNYKIIADGRLLMNYYEFDYTNILYAVNTNMMGMLIKIEYEGGYHMYMFRCVNLMTHSRSMVYFDYPLPKVNECKSIFIEDEKRNDGVITFVIL